VRRPGARGGRRPPASCPKWPQAPPPWRARWRRSSGGRQHVGRGMAGGGSALDGSAPGMRFPARKRGAPGTSGRRPHVAMDGAGGRIGRQRERPHNPCRRQPAHDARHGGGIAGRILTQTTVMPRQSVPGRRAQGSRARGAQAALTRRGGAGLPAQAPACARRLTPRGAPGGRGPRAAQACPRRPSARPFAPGGPRERCRG